MDAICERVVCCSGTVRPCCVSDACDRAPGAAPRLGFRQRAQIQMSADRSHARKELRHWANVRKYREQATSYLELARMTADPDAQNRFIKIAQHYRTLADAEERDAEGRGVERRSGTSDELD
jgi:hypothetical protein